MPGTADATLAAGLLAAGAWVALVALLAVVVLGHRRVRAWVWSGRLPGRLGALPVVDVEHHEAPRGHKTAQLLLEPPAPDTAGGRIRLAGVSIGGVYEVEDVAVCVRGAAHEVPDLACACGFHAFTDRDEATALLARRFGFGGAVIARALLEVDLSGTVIEHDRGFRAGGQRVLAVRLLPWCADCAEAGRLAPAVELGTDGRPAVGAVDWDAREWGEGAAGLRARLHPTQRPLQIWAPLRPVCADHADALRLDGTVLPLVEVAQRLGTEVAWLDPATVPPARVLAGHRPPAGFTP
ncbi:MAG: hypothetical protein ACLGH4_00075 [Actinomycetes bacterium]